MTGPSVMLVGGLLVILEGLVVRDVVTNGSNEIISGQTGMVRAANRAAQRVRAGGGEPALEPAPGDSLGVEPVPDVAPGDGDHAGALEFRVGDHAIVVARPRIPNHGPGGCRIGNIAGRVGGLAVGPERHKRRAKRVAGNQIQGAGSGRTISGAEGVVAHGEVLRVVPKSSHGVAVVVAHGAGRAKDSVVAAQFLYELIHQSAIRGCLLVSVVVVLIAGHRNAAVNAKRIGEIGVVFEQAGIQAIGVRCRAGGRAEIDGSVIIGGGQGIGPEIVVIGNVLLENHDDVFDGSRGRGTALSGCRASR